MIFLSVLLLVFCLVSPSSSIFPKNCEEILESAPDTVKKTKTWKKCHQDNDDVLGCVRSGYTADFLRAERKDHILCSYGSSPVYKNIYQNDLDKRKATAIKNYKESEEFKEEEELIRQKFVKYDSKERANKRIATSTMEYQENVTQFREELKRLLRTVSWRGTELIFNWVDRTYFNVLHDLVQAQGPFYPSTSDIPTDPPVMERATTPNWFWNSPPMFLIEELDSVEDSWGWPDFDENLPLWIDIEFPSSPSNNDLQNARSKRPEYTPAEWDTVDDMYGLNSQFIIAMNLANLDVVHVASFGDILDHVASIGRPWEAIRVTVALDPCNPENLPNKSMLIGRYDHIEAEGTMSLRGRMGYKAKLGQFQSLGDEVLTNPIKSDYWYTFMGVFEYPQWYCDPGSNPVPGFYAMTDEETPCEGVPILQETEGMDCGLLWDKEQLFVSASISISEKRLR